MGCIYQIKNIVTNKIYIGSTWKTLNARKSEHVAKLRKNKHHSPYLQNAWNKYGIENFEFSTLEETIERDLLQEREVYWFNLLNPMYNAARVISRGGQLINGHTPEILAKIVENRNKTIQERGYLHSTESRELIKQARARQVFTEESQRKKSETMTGRKCAGRKLTEETKIKISQANKGRIKSTEEREKISKAQKGKIIPLDVREKMAVARTGKKSSEQAKKNQSISGKKRYINPFDMFDLNMNYLRSFDNIMDAVEHLGWRKSTKANISACLKGRYTYTHGYIFKYKVQEVQIG